MNDEELKNVLMSNISSCIDIVFEAENMKSFIEIFKNLYFYDYKNLLLIWRQKPDAKVLLGASALNNLNIKASDKTPRIALLYPVFNMTKETDSKIIYHSDYKVIFTYEMSSVSEIPKIDHEATNIMSKVKEITCCTINETAGNITGMNLGYYDETKNEILIRRNLSDLMLSKTLISIFTDISLGDDNSEFHIIKKAFVKYMVYAFFEVVTGEDNISILCSMYKKKGGKEKSDMLKEMCKEASEIIMDLTGHLLTFNQTAIANNLLTSDYYQIIAGNLSEVSKNIEDDYLSEEVLEFSELLSLTDDNHIRELFNLVSKKKLYSYPPYPLTFKSNDNKEVHYDRKNK